jgi:hypothetical protein
MIRQSPVAARRRLHWSARATWLALTAAVIVAVPMAAAASTASDQRIARESVLRQSDVPTGFGRSATSKDDQQYPSRACKSVRRGRDALDSASSKEVEFRTTGGDSGGALINNKVAVFSSVKGARGALAAYDGPQAGECLRATYEKVFRDQLNDPKATVDVKVDAYLPDLGDASTGYEVTIDASAKGQAETFYVDVELIRVGRGVDAFGFFNSGGPPPPDDVTSMTKTGVDRLETAL